MEKSVELWSLTPAALEGEVWRLWTGHLVHYDFVHLLVNALALCPPLLLLGVRERRRWLRRMAYVAPLLSLILLYVGGFDELRGASGLVMVIWAGAGLELAQKRKLVEGSILVMGVVGKLVLERTVSSPIGTDGFEVATAAHAAGALIAAAVVTAGFLFNYRLGVPLGAVLRGGVRSLQALAEMTERHESPSSRPTRSGAKGSGGISRVTYSAR